jgi:hypothetical protein
VPAPPSPTLPAPPATLGPETPSLPPLAESDGVVRELTGPVSSHPGLTQWLATDHLVARFVAAVDNVADGDSPRGHVAFLAPRDGFRAVERGERVTLDPASYERYTAVAEVVASLDAAECVALYRRVQPLADAAYRELGRTDRTFDAALRQAIARLLETPVPDGEVALRPRVTTWAFVDRRLEALSPAQKHLLRLGPRNARLVQEKLREIAAALDAGGSP